MRVKQAPPVISDFSAMFPVAPGEEALVGLKLISRDKFIIRPQARKTFPKSEMAELRQSIMELKERRQGIEGTGILTPLLVTPREVAEGSQGYLLIDGERRTRASAEANDWLGLSDLPCVVIDVSDAEVRLMQLISFVQRKDLQPLDEAAAFDELVEGGMAERELARLLGKDKAYVQNRRRLLKMQPDVQQMVAERPDTLRHAYHISQVESPRQRARLERDVVDKRLSVRDVEAAVSAMSAPAPVVTRSVDIVPTSTPYRSGQRILESLQVANLKLNLALSDGAQMGPAKEQLREIETKLAQIEVTVGKLREALGEYRKVRAA